MAVQPSRGEVWIANLDPILGHEQGGQRPVLIISTNLFNQGLAELVFVLPITSKNRHIPSHISINPPEGGLTVPSLILCDAIRSVSKKRLGKKALGVIKPKTMQKVEEYLRILMDL